MNIPKELKYTKDHEWVRSEGSSFVVGITEFAQSELGEIVFVDLPDAGKKFSKGAALCVVESTKAASDVYAPLSGVVEAKNDKLGANPELVNSSPYADGWMVKLKDVAQSELSSLMSAEQYQAHIGAK